MGVIISLFFPWNLYGKYPSYLKMKHKSIINEYPLSSELYIPLTAVEMEDVSPEDANEFSKHYSPEEILKIKRQIIFDDLLKPTQHSDSLKFVLVEGVPGIGKSTLAKEICQRWSTNPTADNHLKQFSLVILVKLRNIQHPTTLFDLLPKDFNTNMKEIEQQLNKTYGQNVLWILDGFDELPYNQRQEGSLYCRLIEGDILEKSTVLVTSRSTATGALVQFIESNKSIAKRIMIVGFNSSRIKEYVKEYFKDKPDRLPSFNNYYNSTPVLKRLMYIPLNAAIVCKVYDESYTRQLQFPKSMTELYDAFTRALILKHLIVKKQVPKNFGMPYKLMCKEDFKLLPETAQDKFWNLTKLAYDGVRTQQYIFNNTMMTDIKDNLGLMNTVSDFSVSSGTQNTSSFLHTTLQEYLAALYIANKPKEFAKEMFFHIIGPLQKSWFTSVNELINLFTVMSLKEQNGYFDKHVLSLNRHSKNLEVVLVFYAGITGKIQIESDDHTFTVLSESELYSTLFARCIYESPQLSTKYQKQHLLINPFLSMVPLDYYIVGYLISHYNISLTVKTTSADNYEFLSEGIRSFPKEAQGQLTLLNIKSFHFESMQLFQLPKVAIKGLSIMERLFASYIINITKSFPHLQLLYYHFPISCNMICVHLQTLDHLTELTINLKGTYEELSSLMPLIKPERPIKHLKLILSYDDCPPSHAVRVRSTRCKINFKEHLLYISQNKNLKELVIGYECPMTIFSLVSTTQLRSITLGESNYKMYYVIFKLESLSMFSGHRHLPCSKICASLISLK